MTRKKANSNTKAQLLAALSQAQIDMKKQALLLAKAQSENSELLSHNQLLASKLNAAIAQSRSWEKQFYSEQRLLKDYRERPITLRELLSLWWRDVTVFWQI